MLGVETKYSQLEKLASHIRHNRSETKIVLPEPSITVLTTFPLKNILYKPKLSGRLTKWTVELSEHQISFQPRTMIKSQVLTDFIAHFSPDFFP